MPSQDKCPFCGGSALVQGRLDYPDKTESFRAWFKPAGVHLPFLKNFLNSSVTCIEDQAQACLTCGHVWADLCLGDLKKLIRDFGSDELKTRLSSALLP